MSDKKVKMWEEVITIPTYPVGEPDKNPMFLEKRVYQGSSGKVYPHSVIDKIYDTKEDREYLAVFLENEYLKIMILPQLGGRIQRAVDKTNDYDFVYYNHVIKPALVGLTGPWISGGIEFNWPQHHRPSTFDEIDYYMEKNPDGSCTVWVGEIETMFRTKGMAGFTLSSGKAYLEIKVRLYNRTNVPQTFLWWANPAIAANDNTRSIFPPDVHTVMDHGKRDVSNFPIATGTYYKMDYSAGVDISRYKNILVPTSYMAYHSDYDFMGGYDDEKKAGILHIANHYISPGKKQWTWGCGEFGKAWDKNLTDEDGAYIELMTGCFTDNQPDFSWLMPYEEKTFTQYFMPYKGVGKVLQANKDIIVGMELIEKGKLQVGVYTTSMMESVTILVQEKKKTDYPLSKETVTLSPKQAYVKEFLVSDFTKEWDYEIKIIDEKENELLSVCPLKPQVESIPTAASPIPMPDKVKTTQELYLYGIHLEQYRHATYEPENYYLEGLNREPDNFLLNQAYGKLLFKRGQFKKAHLYFQNAVKTLIKTNPNPYDAEPFYFLGLTLKYLGDLKQAYTIFYKATWNAAWQDSAFYQLACISCRQKDYQIAIEQIEYSLIRNWHNMKARNLKAVLLRKLGRTQEAFDWIEQTRKIDPLDFNSLNELIFLKRERKEDASDLLEKLNKMLHKAHNTYLELSIDYIEAGLWQEAEDILSQYLERQIKRAHYPMIYYYLAYINQCQEKEDRALYYAELGQNACSDFCFPHRLEDILVLEVIKEILPKGSKAFYYLGCLWYDKRQYKKAIKNWQQAKQLDPDFATVYRNLALAYYNKTGEKKRALKEMEKAFILNPNDSRVLLELDQLHKKMGWSSKKRLEVLENALPVVEIRDDLYLEYLTLLNLEQQYQKVNDKILARNFHPWEGGEGKVSSQYILCRLGLAKQVFKQKDDRTAEWLLQSLTKPYPKNLGEGRLEGTKQNHIYYFLGLLYEKIGCKQKAISCFEKATIGQLEPVGMMYYNDQPPEMIYYQGMALRKLQREKEAMGKFHHLIDYGKKHLFDQVQIDYFAVSLPDLQIFEEDLDQKNQVHCLFLMALGHLGIGEIQLAKEEFSKVKEMEPCHMGSHIFSFANINL